MSQNLSSAAIVIGALRVNYVSTLFVIFSFSFYTLLVVYGLRDAMGGKS